MEKITKLILECQRTDDTAKINNIGRFRAGKYNVATCKNDPNSETYITFEINGAGEIEAVLCDPESDNYYLFATSRHAEFYLVSVS